MFLANPVFSQNYISITEHTLSIVFAIVICNVAAVNVNIYYSYTDLHKYITYNVIINSNLYTIITYHLPFR